VPINSTVQHYLRHQTYGSRRTSLRSQVAATSTAHTAMSTTWGTRATASSHVGWPAARHHAAHIVRPLEIRRPAPAIVDLHASAAAIDLLQSPFVAAAARTIERVPDRTVRRQVSEVLLVVPGINVDEGAATRRRSVRRGGPATAGGPLVAPPPLICCSRHLSPLQPGQ
jgi:hypothetical protein